MRYEITRDAATTTLRLSHHLAFADRRAFIELIPELLRGQVNRLVVDMKDLRFLDSAGLGMLLSLKDAAEKGGTALVLRDPTAGVLTLLKLARFDTLVPIETC